jgi:predicted AlkP superfamily pyrophosphatase or phosphodiesterase
MAQFWVNFKPGFAASYALTAPLTGPSKQKGTHGYFPDSMELRATFIIDGPGIKAKGSLGDIDMRDIAPTLAKILEVKLPAAEGKPLF